MTNNNLDRSIITAELSLKEAEASFGSDNIAVAEQLVKLATLLRQKNRVLDAVNAEARARVIWEKNPGSASSISQSPMRTAQAGKHGLDQTSILRSKLDPEAVFGLRSKDADPLSESETKAVLIARLILVCAVALIVVAHDLVFKIIAGLITAPIGLALLLLLIAPYFFPTIVAKARHKENVTAIFVLNLFLGWTIVGWVVALVWAVSKDTNAQVGAPSNSKGDLKGCPDCAESVKAQAKKCRFCGHTFDHG